MAETSDAGWNLRQSSELYGIFNWGGGHFSVGETGNVHVHPDGPGTEYVDLLALVEDIQRRGHSTPLLIRFDGILRSRVRELADCFTRAFKEYEYTGSYRGVYPIKANQQRQVVEQLIRPHEQMPALGLEVGSKPELLIALAMLEEPGALIVCNGYKDHAYIEMALLAQRLGRHCVIVLDRPQELEMVIKTSRDLGISPSIGVRARLAARGEGRWVESSGDLSKFGLTAAQIVRSVERLRSEDMLACLEMLHFHMGSQITAIRAHKDALREAAQIFVGLRALGANVNLVDVGGGLGVDYDGSKSDFHSSMNYTAQEYAMDVVAALAEACEKNGLQHPDIVTEAGRATVSHASVLVFDVLDVDGRPRSLGGEPPPSEDEPAVIRELREVRAAIAPGTALECYHDAQQAREQGLTLFTLGYLDLAARARMEELFWGCCSEILAAIRDMEHVPEDLQGLERELADTYYGNFSVFQSLPDSWALNQLFPVMPIHRLDERPTRRGVIADLTCDSDGKLDQFIDLQDVRNVLELHAPNGRPYYIGVFLVGAYQETLGELHNLFGDTDVVHVELAGPGRYRIEHLLEGDTVEEVLSYVQYDRRDLTERVRRSIEKAVQSGELTLEEAVLLRRRFVQGLSGYTYLDRD